MALLKQLESRNVIFGVQKSIMSLGAPVRIGLGYCSVHQPSQQPQDFAFFFSRKTITDASFVVCKVSVRHLKIFLIRLRISGLNVALTLGGKIL